MTAHEAIRRLSTCLLGNIVISWGAFANSDMAISIRLKLAIKVVVRNYFSLGQRDGFSAQVGQREFLQIRVPSGLWGIETARHDV